MSETPLTILYNSFGGRFSDSPRAIYEELVKRNFEADHVWLAKPYDSQKDPFPSDVRKKVISNGVAAREDLGSIDVIISNTYLLGWDRSSSAIYVQTWHGTPLKRLLNDTNAPRTESFAEASRDTQRWDYFVSPNRFSTTTLAGAFQFKKEIWETGYPRNDLLNSPSASDVRNDVRDSLGIPDDKTVVLYAPTYRDDTGSYGSFSFALELDLKRVSEQLGDDHVLLLRLHYMVRNELGELPPGVIDVCDYEDINELYLAADVLLTDYSSVMFDFAVTGKPIIFFVYDLEKYKNELRGFYFEFETDAPGPLLRTTNEVIESLRSLPEVRQQYANLYGAFQKRFAHLDDGHATERVVDRLLAAIETRQFR